MQDTPQKAAKTAAGFAVVGAGVMGLCAALAAARAGHRVRVYDPGGFPALGSASALAGGMLAPFAEADHMPVPWATAGVRSIGLWQEIAAFCGHARDFGLRCAGSLLVAHGADAHVLARFQTYLQAHGDFPWLRAPQIATHAPMLGGAFDTGLYLPQEAHLNPAAALAVLVETLRDQDVMLVEKAVDPAPIAKDYAAVIDCRGMGAAQDEPELRGVKGEVAMIRNPDFTLDLPVRVMHPRYSLYVVQQPEHVFIIGATQIESEADTHVSVRSALELLSALSSLHPSFLNAQILSLRAGMRPTYPDNLPRITRAGNIIRCNGAFRHGWLLAPLMAACAVDCLEDKENEFMSLFRRNHDHDHHQRPQQNLSRRA